jgi:folate-binding protein YgfZ
MQTSQISPASVATARISSAWHHRSSTTILKLSGSDRIDLLHRLSTNDLTGLKPGHGKHTVLVTDKARIIDVLAVLQGEHESYLLCSPGYASAITTWLRKYIIMDDVKISDVSSQYDVLEFCGPRSAEVLEQMLQCECSTFAIDQWCAIDAGSSHAIITRQPSVCEMSFWVVGSSDFTSELKTTLAAHAELVPELTDSDYEYLRVTAGLGKHGHEWTDAFNPLEAGLLHYTSFAKGCYIGQEVIARLDSYNKVKQRVMGLACSQKLTPGDRLFAESSDIGVVTSVTPSCDGTSWLALGYVRGEHAHVDAPLVAQTTAGAVAVTQHLLPMEDPSCR